MVGILLGVVVFGDRIQDTPGELAIYAGGLAALVAGVIMVGRAPALSQLRAWTEESSRLRRPARPDAAAASPAARTHPTAETGRPASHQRGPPPSRNDGPTQRRRPTPALHGSAPVTDDTTDRALPPRADPRRDAAVRRPDRERLAAARLHLDRRHGVARARRSADGDERAGPESPDPAAHTSTPRLGTSPGQAQPACRTLAWPGGLT